MPFPVITFDDRDMRYESSQLDKPMVISVVAVEYKIKRVLIDQGGSANILYWSTYKKLGLPSTNLDECSGMLYGFTGNQVPIKRVIELKTMFWEDDCVRSIPVIYTIVDVDASYIIMRQPTLNRLGAVVSTLHLCMKIPIRRRVGSVWADSRLAQCCYEDSLRVGSQPSRFEHERPFLVEDLKEIQTRPSTAHKTKIGIMLVKEEESRLTHFLIENRDVFAWTLDDMPSIDLSFMCHRLSIAPRAKPVVQKKQKQGEEKRRAAKEETSKLLVVGFIKEVQYLTWLANVVMMKKASGKWQMCTDYTNLNKACPKDPYPLPNIDRLVDGASGFALLSFMDVPAYQHLMDKIFKDVIGNDVEVYVDDMVVKSTIVSEHCSALERVFGVLRRHQLKLNPEKCSFGVQARRFLGFMLTERGIEANPKKCQAVINMRSPQSIKEVQQLVGRITTLSRFISWLEKTAMPIFDTLKKGGNFAWTPESEKAFLRLKALSAAPLVLTRPTPGREAISNLFHEQGPTRCREKILENREGSPCSRHYFAKATPLLPRTGHIKAQVLANFIIELTLGRQSTSEGREWFLSIDGASNQAESGAGSLHFEFKASNNQVEYEALLVGIRLARELEAKILTAKSDSKLVIGQLPGDTTKAKRLVREALKYTLVSQQLYRRGFSFPLLRCVDKEESEYIIWDVHEGVCGTHIGGRALASKIARASYYYKKPVKWPN
ncbi:Retrovirus-related Pol polyprotein from transposon 17.6, partial [Mucuna pruriens]